MTAPLIESSNLHFFTAEVIVDEVNLQSRVGSITRVRVAANELIHCVERLRCNLLVAGHVTDLFVVIERDQVIGVRRVLVARMDREKTLSRFDRFLMVARHVIAKRAHELRAPRPR